MKNSNNHSFSHKIKLRIRVLWIIFVLMLAYMVIISELGGGDSRIMTPLAESVSRIIFFGGLIFVCYRIYFNKKLLENRLLLKEKFLDEQDERNQYLHDKRTLRLQGPLIHLTPPKASAHPQESNLHPTDNAPSPSGCLFAPGNFPLDHPDRRYE